MPEETFVIAGAGLAGAKAAETLREEGFAGRVLLVGEEIERPYERPPLSKGFLLDKEPRDKAHVHEADWYDKHDVELRVGTSVAAVDRGAHQVRLSTREPIAYDKLLLATGASPRRLDVPGSKLQGIHYLRTMADSAALKQALAPGGRRVVVAGAGWIGLEAAAAAREHGNEVTLIEPEPVPLHAAMGPELGGMFADLHREHGVVLRMDEGVAGFWGAGQVSAVVTSGGAEVPADVVIVGIGVRPNSRLAEEAGLEVSDGILVDQSLRTSDPDIYAAGDVANAYHPLLGRRIRVEHWANALNGGPAAARAMLGRDVVYDQLPYFFSDQYELGMEMSGAAAPGEYDEVVYRGDVPGREFLAFWLSGGRVVAGMNVNVWDVTGDVQALIRSGRPVDAARLADPGVPLADLA
ncbi:3-phenylpropionate/trans-cinnamate dioxygenase ferredoxin reductase subunit [Actinomadura coerulea]|uniref:3-phenylpropionate/trans-cinnamate dioxygenase ferredoxin reductase subunit n=1 Tax=Actinomadura coerulea TaxID=46159 RepID=A0A7X0FTN4_9ACTN|nr:FAD-dependent oxidoreductase [Actinomadura coerulea]MBB6393489.1 3-phenylpropionate/trans-cinnamate dioxygenase ferredoxin reductase subunit [Actinomadura coerulea]GGP92550.1 ferredoxin [Actinomadura coerulea]